MAGDVETLLDEILDVQRQLRELPADAFEERAGLRARLVELHAAAAQAADQTTTAASLRRYLRQLEQRRDAALSRHLGPSWQDGSVGGMGIPADQVDDFNRRIDEAGDLPALEREITRVRARLEAGSPS